MHKTTISIFNSNRQSNSHAAYGAEQNPQSLGHKSYWSTRRIRTLGGHDRRTFHSETPTRSYDTEDCGLTWIDYRARRLRGIYLGRAHTPRLQTSCMDQRELQGNHTTAGAEICFT